MSNLVGNLTSYTFTASNLDNPSGPSYGPHFISFGKADTTVVPDLNNLSLTVDPTLTVATLSNDTFNFASNIINGGKGADTIYGTLESINLSASNGGVISGVDLIFGGVELTYGCSHHFDLGNVIYVGNGEDTVYGTMNELDLTATGINNVPAGSLITSSDFSMYSNVIIAGDGANDHLYGTMDILALNSFGIASDFGPPLTTIGGYLNSGGNTFTFGDPIGHDFIGNTIIAGNGNDDQLFGTVGNIQLYETIPTSVIGGSSGGFNDFLFGQNFLYAGNGMDDQLFGTAQQLTLNASSGDLIGGWFGGGNTFTFGNNVVLAGHGAGDMLFGSLQNFTLSADPTSGQGSYIGGADGGYNIFNFGNNIVGAGNGANDALYGTLQNLSFVVGEGSFIGGFDSSDYNSITFGNNTVSAGNGNGDLLVGSMYELSLTNNADLVGNIITFGHDVLQAGNGDTTLVGELNDIVTPGDTISISSFIGSNQIIPGENTFDLGKGADTVVFDPAIDIGKNIINGWNGGNDILEFNNTESLATLESRITFSSDNHGGTLLSLSTVLGDTHNSNGGSIDFIGVAFHSNETVDETLHNLVHNIANHLKVHH